MREPELCCLVSPKRKCPSCNLTFCKECSQTKEENERDEHYRQLRETNGLVGYHHSDRRECNSCGASSYWYES